MPLAGHGLRPTALRRRAGRPQLKRDPLGGAANFQRTHTQSNPMAFDETLAGRIRLSLGKRKGLKEKKMFGGIAFLLNGNMCCGVHRSEMIVRLAPDATDQALTERHTRLFDLTGRPMKGWVLVDPAGLKTDDKVAKWVAVAAKYASSLPPK